MDSPFARNRIELSRVMASHISSYNASFVLISLLATNHIIVHDFGGVFDFLNKLTSGDERIECQQLIMLAIF